MLSLVLKSGAPDLLIAPDTRFTKTVCPGIDTELIVGINGFDAGITVSRDAVLGVGVILAS